MSQLTPRNIEILKIIVEEYIETWEVIWSKLLLKKYDLWVSSATVRNDMAFLESLNLIYQPYNSAWRLPTSKWLRAFVNYLMRETPDYFLKEKNKKISRSSNIELSEFIHKIVFELSRNTKEISFFIIPEDKVCEYSWVSNFLKINYKRIWEKIYSIVDMLENKFDFIKFIESFPIQNSINVFIWEENITEYLRNYSIIIKPIMINSKIWYVWIIWSLKMNYSFNISAVRWII